MSEPQSESHIARASDMQDTSGTEKSAAPQAEQAEAQEMPDSYLFFAVLVIALLVGFFKLQMRRKPR
jgi:hypothetical protein